MPGVSVPGGGHDTSNLSFTSGDALPYASQLAASIGAAVDSGALVPLSYVPGEILPEPPEGSEALVTFSQPSPAAIVVGLSDAAVVDSASAPLDIWGGAPGASVLAGSGGLVYTNITPSGDQIASIVAGDGTNFIETAATGTGNYQVNTGAGADSIVILNGNATVNAGTGNNLVVLGGGPQAGNSVVYAEGYDSIVGNTVSGGGGNDVVNVGSGQVTINPGSSNFVVFGDGINPLTFLPGTGSDTVAVGTGGGIVTGGLSGNNLLIGGLSFAGTTLHGTANGDLLFAVGGGAVFATAGAGAETISGAGGTTPLLPGYTAPVSTANNVFTAGSGNDTLLAGLGSDTLIGGTGQALMVAGAGADVFRFNNGASGGSDTITGFKATDTLELSGYGANPVANIGSTPGGTGITLTDGTFISISNVQSIAPQQIRIV